MNTHGSASGVMHVTRTTRRSTVLMQGLVLSVTSAAVTAQLVQTIRLFGGLAIVDAIGSTRMELLCQERVLTRLFPVEG